MTTSYDINAGFMPLLDAAILIAAVENGHAASEGLSIRLVRETSWANIRDRLAVGQFDAAHCLAPMPIAANLGLTPFDMKMVVPMALGLGGNAVTISLALWQEMSAGDVLPGGLDPAIAAEKLSSLIMSRRDRGAPKVRFGVVHPHSAHNLELRYWLASSGIAPEADVEILVLPPGLMPDALAGGKLDGFCVGEPWNSVAVAEGSGRILATKNAIWASSPEKVLAIPLTVSEREPKMVAALLRALYEAAKWCSKHENRNELAHILSGSSYLGVDRALILEVLGGPAQYEPYARAATFPWQSHALWFYSQLVRWGYATHTPGSAINARETYRPDMYRDVLSIGSAIIPSANAKVEGALTMATPVGAGAQQLVLGPDAFFDNQTFDPDHLESYIAAQRKF